jgi:hypothetical protein
MDKRILQKKILSGEMSEQNLKEYLESLPDLSDAAEEMTVDLEHRK